MAANAGITLTNQAGNLTVAKDIYASGTGSVDARTANGFDITINSAKIKSDTGTLQLVAGRNIASNTPTGTSVELQTAGNVLIKAGGAVGTATNGIDIGGGVANLAVLTSGGPTAGAVFVNQSDGSLNIGTVTAVNATSSLDNAVGDLSGVTTSNNNITLTATAGPDDVTLGANVASGTGKVWLEAGRDLIQTSGYVTAEGGAVIKTGRVASLLQAGNRVQVLAAQTGRDLNYLEAGALDIGTVAGKSGIDAGGRAWVRAQGDMNLRQNVVARGNGTEAAVLIADGAFRNLNGANAITTPNSRWLVYDLNPNLEYRLDGLDNNFRKINSTYETYPPEIAYANGNLYITNARIVTDNEFALPLAAGSTAVFAAQPNAGIDAPLLPAFSIATAVGADRPAPQMSNAGLEIFPVNAPLMIATQTGKFFDAPLEGFLAGEGVESAALASGQALPAWVTLDTGALRLRGVMPKDGQSVELRVRLKGKDGQAGRVINVLLASNS